MHRTNDRDVVDVLGRVLKDLADFDAAFTVLLKLVRRRKRRAGLAFGG